jgi:hypothetical protein
MAASMATARNNPTASLLPDGKILVAGGENSGGSLATSELYDPAANSWAPTGSMNTARSAQLAQLLLNGKVLVIGSGNLSQTSELYDPAQGVWSTTGSIASILSDYPSTLLTDGRVLIGGGQAVLSYPTNCQIYDIGQSVSPSSQPQITTFPSTLTPGSNLVITGTRFLGISESSGGNSTAGSPSDNPIVQLRSLEGGQTTYLLATNWSATSFASAPVGALRPGVTLITMFVNGIPSVPVVLNLTSPAPTPITLLPTDAGQFTFTNTPGATFTVLASTNLTAPLAGWTPVGSASESPLGHFQFTDTQASNFPQRFYGVRWP